ncbi:MAG: 2-amino-4-hydroxy-6-hydroxymethyldihydropteridine diphosphokinase [Prolixibacteraceae bacterium]
MARLFLLLGGNLGDKERTFAHARVRLEEELGNITQMSSVYETEPWGFRSDYLFWNQIILIETKWSPGEVLRKTKVIEQELGRVRKAERYSSRLIDIDLLFYDDLVFHEPQLELPHPRIIDRRFVLEPLAEIAPNMLHPVFRQTIMELLENCSDTLSVKKMRVTENSSES